MPNDSDIGRDLASQLTAAYGARIREVNFTYDAYLQFEELETDRPYAIVSPNGYDEVRETRMHWRETCQLVFTVVSKAGPSSEQSWIDDWLDSWDLMMREARDMVMLGKHKVLNIERDERFDVDVFHNHNRLLTQSVFNFGNVR